MRNMFKVPNESLYELGSSEGIGNKCSGKEALMQKKCAICDILLDVPCSNPMCDGHHNESMGDVCVYCGTNEREKMLYLGKFSNPFFSSLGDIGDDWTEHDERAMLEI